VLERLVRSPRVRVSLLTVFLACCAYGLYAAWPQAMTALARLHWYSVTLALAAAMAGAWCMMLAWRAVLADLGSPLPLGAAARTCFVAQLGKYAPGAVWAFAAQVELGRDAGVPRQRVTLAVQQPLERRPSWGGLAAALGWTVLGWLAFGMQVWLLLASTTGRGAHVMFLATGGYALAFAAGLLLVVFPNGIGAREVILIAALAPVAPHGAALAVALAARLLTTVSDLAWGFFGLTLGRCTCVSGW
jgi:uncharacterized membrane protein YbhN (UPF0104 family)